MTRRILTGMAAVSLLMGGCTTAIRYQRWNNTDPLPAGALRFTLPESTITLTRPGVAAVIPPSQTDNCPATATAADWGGCFNYVAASASIAPPAVQPGTDPVVYLAVPDDRANHHLSTTTITGAPVAGTDALYTSVTVGYADNSAKVIASAASGASTGFGIAGPFGAAAGLALGGLQAVASVGGAAQGEAEPPRPALTDYLCKDVDVDLKAADASLPKPYLTLPVTIAPATARPFASADVVQSFAFAPSLCWHALPNATQVGVVRLSAADAPFFFGPAPARKPVKGDGWLYRIVSATDPSAAPPGATSAAAYFAAKGPHHDFPYSACRKVVVQVTWWKELAEAVDRVSPGADPKPRVVSFRTVVADPDFVNVADVRKGGVITFKPDCGAYVAAAVDTSAGADITAAVNAAQTILAAEQAWKAGSGTP